MTLIPNSTKKSLITVLVLVCAIMAIGLMMACYLHFTQVEEQAHVDQMVHESATQSVALIHERLSSNMAYIKALGCMLGKGEAPITSAKTLQSIQGNQEVKKIFTSITIATTDGTLYGVDGNVVGNIAHHAHFQSALAGNVTISDMEQSLNDQKNVIFVTAPIERNGKIIGIVNGRFLMSSLTKFLSAEFFDGRGYNYMANADGHIFVWADNPKADHNFINIYESFKMASSVSDTALQEMRQRMQRGLSGRISYEWHGEKRTMNYMPVGINDWYLLSVIPNEIVTSRTMALTEQAFTFTGALLIILIMLIFYMDGARRKDQSALAAVHKELLTIYNTIPGGVFQCRLDDNFTLIEANDGFYRFIGYTKDVFERQFANEIVRLIRLEDVERIKDSINKQLMVGQAITDEARFVGADGTTKWILLSGEVAQYPTGESLLYCNFTDVSELKRTQEELRDAKQRYELIMAETQDIIFEWNIVDRSIYHSKIFEEKFGYPLSTENFPQSIIEQHLLPPEDEQKFLDIYHQIETGSHFAVTEFRIKKADGQFLWCRVSVTAVLDENNQPCRAVGVIEDIDHVKRQLQAITEESQRDAMTGLYNRVTTIKLIEQRLKLPLHNAALLLVDIDNFKDINDTLGHASGDVALTEVSYQLKHLFRVSDIVGRVGGDEFMVFAEGLGQGDVLAKKLTDISSVFNWSFRKKDITYFISCSIGITLFPKDGCTYEELVRKADAALYFAKQNGKKQFAIYSDNMLETIHGMEDVTPLRAEDTTTPTP